MSCEAGTDRELRVVLIDDDEQVLNVHCSMVVSMGYGITSFTSPLEAVDYLASNRNSVDLIITDYRMPQMSGLELLNRIHIAGLALPAIILTGYPDEVSRDEADRYGASIVCKPIRMAALADHIHQASAGA